MKLLYGQWFYICENNNARIDHTMLDGSGWTTYGASGTGTGRFQKPYGIHVDNSTGYVYVADTANNRIVKTKMDGTGWTTYGTKGSGIGNFDNPYDIFYDKDSEFIYVSDSHNHRIVKTKIDGTGWTTYGSYGNKTGQFGLLRGIYYNSPTNMIYISDGSYHRIIKTSMDGVGWKELGFFGNGTGQFQTPNRIYYDHVIDYVFVADSGNHRIVKTMMNGSGWTTYGSRGSGKGQFYFPSGIWKDDSSEYLYVADTNNNRIVRTTMNGSGWYIFGTYGTGSTAGNFNNPYDVMCAGESYTKNGYLISKKINLNGPVNLLTLEFLADFPFNTSIKFQIKSAHNESALDKKNYRGPNGSLGEYYSKSGSNIWSGHNGDQWIQYKIFFNTNAPQSSPVLKDFTITYNLLPLKPKLLAPEPNNWTNSNVTTFVWEHRDSDSDSQSGFQWQIDDDIDFSSVNYNKKQSASSQNTYTPINPIVDGIWYWHVRTKDSDGGWGPYSEPRMLKIDSAAPTSNVNWPKENQYYKKLELITGSTTDLEVSSGVNKTEIQIIRISDNKCWNSNTNVWQQSESWLPTKGYDEWEFNATIVTWTSGDSYRILSRSYDNITNVEIPGEGILFNFDFEEPISTVEIPMNNGLYKELKTISGTAFDNGGAGVKKVEITIREENTNRYWDGKKWVSKVTWLNTIGKTSWTYDSKNVLWDTGIRYYVTSRATDNINIIESSLNEYSFILDVDRPLTFVIHPADNSYVKELDEITGNANDIGRAGIDRVEISIKCQNDDKYWDALDWSRNIHWLLADGTNNWTFDSSLIIWESDTYYCIMPKATDRSGNFIINEPGNRFMYDNKPPAYSFTINEGKEFTNSTYVRLKIDAFDTGSGLAEMTVSPDGITWSDWEDYNYVKYYKLPAEDGQKKVYVKVSDKAGNIAEAASDFISLDTEIPIITILINNDEIYTNTKNVLLNVTALDTLSGISDVSYSNNNKSWGPWVPFNKSVQYSLTGADGEKTIYFRARDKAGNIGFAQDSIILDTTPPHNLTIFINDGNKTTESKAVILKLSADDDVSGVGEMSFCTLNRSWCAWEKFFETKAYELTGGDGQKIVYFKVRDSAGNIAPPTFATIILNQGGDSEDGREPKNQSNENFELLDFIIILIIIIIILIILVISILIRNRNKNKIA